MESGSSRKGKPGPPGPVYGVDIDNELYGQVMARSEAGLHTDDTVLRELLLVLLQKYDKEHYLRERGGKNTFTHSWAQRFYARHKLTLRSCKKKLREMPVDFEAKRESYLNIAAMLISEYNIPPQLVIGAIAHVVSIFDDSHVTMFRLQVATKTMSFSCLARFGQGQRREEMFGEWVRLVSELTKRK